MKYVVSIVLFFISLSSLYSCTNNSRKNYYSESVQDQSILVGIKRFDKDLHRYLQHPSNGLQDSLTLQYGIFLEAFGSVVINNSDIENTSFFAQITGYFSNPQLSLIYKDALDTFQVIVPYERELQEADQQLQKYWKGKQLPQFAMHVSGFKANTIVTDSLISISIDKYLGSDYSGYQNFFEVYQLQQMKPMMITRDYLKAWIIGEIANTNKRKDLLSEMVYQGKILYTLQLLLPEWNEADLMGYSPQQLEWSRNNEKEVWKTIITKNQLFSNDYTTILKYIEDAPYTALVSPQSPGRLGSFIGWQIVKAYADNTGHDLESIIGESDAQNILKQSKYNP